MSGSIGTLKSLGENPRREEGQIMVIKCSNLSDQIRLIEKKKNYIVVFFLIDIH